MSNPPAAQHDITSPEWPPAVQAALAAALGFLLPKGQPVLELCVQPAPTDQSTGAASSVRGLLERRGIDLVGGDLRVPEFSPGPSQKAKPFVLPFTQSSLGGVYAINFPNLDWSALVGETVRVLAPDGIFAIATADEIATDINNHMEVGWETILRRNAVQLRAEGGSRARLDAALKQNGSAILPAEIIAVCRWSEHFTPRSRLEATKARRGANNRHITEAVFARCLKDYERWLKAQYGDLNAPLELIRECALNVWRFSR